MIIFSSEQAAWIFLLGLFMGAGGAWWLYSQVWWITMHRAWAAAHERRRRGRLRRLHGKRQNWRGVWS